MAPYAYSHRIIIATCNSKCEWKGAWPVCCARAAPSKSHCSKQHPDIVYANIPWHKPSIVLFFSRITRTLNMKRKTIFAKILKFVGKGDESASNRMAYLSTKQARLARARRPHRVSLTSQIVDPLPTIDESEEEYYTDEESHA